MYPLLQQGQRIALSALNFLCQDGVSGIDLEDNVVNHDACTAYFASLEVVERLFYGAGTIVFPCSCR